MFRGPFTGSLDHRIVFLGQFQRRLAICRSDGEGELWNRQKRPESGLAEVAVVCQRLLDPFTLHDNE
jgi:hypothetical protein